MEDRTNSENNDNSDNINTIKLIVDKFLANINIDINSLHDEKLSFDSLIDDFIENEIQQMNEITDKIKTLEKQGNDDWMTSFGKASNLFNMYESLKKKRKERISKIKNFIINIDKKNDKNENRIDNTDKANNKRSQNNISSSNSDNNLNSENNNISQRPSSSGRNNINNINNASNLLHKKRRNNSNVPYNINYIPNDDQSISEANTDLAEDDRDIFQFVKENYKTEPARPSNHIIKSTDPQKACAFCNISSKNRKMAKKLGPLYGPISEKSNKYFVHENCALYCDEICLQDETNIFLNVPSSVIKHSTNNCSKCLKKGANIKCTYKVCEKWLHYPCGLEQNAVFDNKKHIMYCCDNHAKGKTVKIDPSNPSFCNICQSALDVDLMGRCKKCLNYFHVYCLEPRLTTLPEGDWSCGNCQA